MSAEVRASTTTRFHEQCLFTNMDRTKCFNLHLFHFRTFTHSQASIYCASQFNSSLIDVESLSEIGQELTIDDYTFWVKISIQGCADYLGKKDLDLIESGGFCVLVNKELSRHSNVALQFLIKSCQDVTQTVLCEKSLN